MCSSWQECPGILSDDMLLVLWFKWKYIGIPANSILSDVHVALCVLVLSVLYINVLKGYQLENRDFF